MALSEQQTSGLGPRTGHWQVGDIAYLKPEKEFTDDEYRDLRVPTAKYPRGYLHAMATGHPVIIVKKFSESSTHVAITPVSAFSSGPWNKDLAPWNQKCHRAKNPL